MDDDTHLKVGDPGHSYKCVSEQVIYFSNQSSFYMNMTIKNVQLQAFRVHNSTYSPGKEYTAPRCILYSCIGGGFKQQLVGNRKRIH